MDRSSRRQARGCRILAGIACSKGVCTVNVTAQSTRPARPPLSAPARPVGPPISKTRSFSTVFLIEMWERFGFYGMQVLMVTYMIKKLGFVDTHSNLVWGAAAALIYATPALGGWIGDKLIGTRRTMLTGAVVLTFGYALLWLPTNDPYA